MDNKKFTVLKTYIQEIIDLIANKKYIEAVEKHTSASELLDEITDHLSDDEDLIEVSKYQVLLNKLFEKLEQ